MNARLLLIEDSSDDATLVVEALRDHGFEPDWVRVETREALRAMLSERQWDAVLCDYNMPGMTAEEAVKIVREHDQNLPFILVSGTVDASVAVGMMRQGMHEYVMKDDLERLGPAAEREIRDSIHRRNEAIARTELFELQSRFGNTFEQSSVGFAHLDRHGRFVWLNGYLAELLGYDREELLGIAYEKFIFQEDWPEVQKRQDQIVNGSIGEYRIEKRYRRKDGTPIWVMLTLTAIRQEEGVPAYLSAVVQDITSRIVAEQALERREREYRSLVETMSEGLLNLDLEGRLLFANQRFCAMTGYELSELEGKNMVDFFIDPEEQSSVKEKVAVALRGEPSGFQARIHHRDGHEIWIEVSTVPRVNREGEVIGRLSVVSDVTGRRQSEQEQQRLRTQIEELNRIESLGKLAGNMAHEFNNVLMGIQPFTEVIRRLSPGNEKIDQAAQFIFDAVQRGQRVSQEILRFARPAPPERTEMDVDDLLDRVAKVGGGIVGSSHRLLIEAMDQRLRFTIDREQLIQVFTNLMINARDAMEPGGTITIRTECDPAGAKYPFGVVDHPERFVHITFSDTGPGIPPEIGNRIFEPMFTTKRTGTGLGLAIAHQIVTTHEGFIFLDSEIGTGTTFHLFLPLTVGHDVQGEDRMVSSAGSDR
jgi:two-component system, cell cycle sensor histidine kinase and response regulator CckA